MKKSITLILSLVASICAATEYFVDKRGLDDNDGTTTGKAFFSISRGVRELAPGDVLTVGPGEYNEAVKLKDFGDISKSTVIRARFPRTVLMRGDVPAPAFRKKAGTHFVYEAAFDQHVQAVNERDSLRIYSNAPSVKELDFKSGCFHYDAKNKKLYVTTSDFSAPDKHFLTISVIRDSGLMLTDVRNVIVEGFAFTGYNCDTPGGRPGVNAKWGVLLTHGENCVIRDCVTFMNGGGISVSGNKNTIEGCESYGNFSQFCGVGGNIVYWGPVEGGIIRDCLSYSTKAACIRFYEGVIKNCLIENVKTWGGGNSDVWIKGRVKNSITRNSIIRGNLQSKLVENSIFNFNGYNRSPSIDNIVLSHEKKISIDAEFADPRNMDFHLQATSRYRGSGTDGADRGVYPYKANIFYLSTTGNDAADGLSVEKPWRSITKAVKKLKAGDTLYLLPGIYSQNVEVGSVGTKKNPIVIRGRGVKPVAISGMVDMKGARHLRLERLALQGASSTMNVSDCEDISIENCVFFTKGRSITAFQAKRLCIEHSVFAYPDTSAIEFTKCSAITLNSNLFNNYKSAAVLIDSSSAVLYSDYNSYRDPKVCWSVDGKRWDFKALRKRSDSHSVIVEAKFSYVTDKLPILENDWEFNGKSRLGKPIGAYSKNRTTDMAIVGPFVHSVGDSSVNIEWWTSRPSTTTLYWGESEKCLNKSDKSSNVKISSYYGTYYHTVSLTGLKPGQKYYFKVESLYPKFEYHIHAKLKAADERKPRIMVSSNVDSFTTKIDKPRKNRSFYVSLNGDDGNDGLSSEKSWRTISYAAGKVRPGDTVLVAKGTYNETIRPRVTGVKDAPINFKPIPGDKVFIKGFHKTLSHAFVIQNKNNIVVDGFHFKDFGNILGSDAGTLLLVGSRNITVRRCFNDGRSTGYSPQFIMAKECPDLSVENCVVIRCFLAGLFFYCPDLHMRNNVFYGNQMTSLTVVNAVNQKVFFSNNLFFDNLPTKIYNPIIRMRYSENLVLKNNCFYLRIPERERNTVFVAVEKGANIKLGSPVSSFSQRNQRNDTSIFENPKVPLINEIITYPSKKQWLTHRGLKDNHKVPTRELFINKDKSYKQMDFNDFFATNEILIKCRIGLLKSDFEDFTFNSNPPHSTP